MALLLSPEVARPLDLLFWSPGDDADDADDADGDDNDGDGRGVPDHLAKSNLVGVHKINRRNTLQSYESALLKGFISSLNFLTR